MEKYLRTVTQDPASPSPTITLAPKTLSFGPSHTKKLKSPNAARDTAAANQKSRTAAADTAAAAATAARTVNEALDQLEDSIDNQPPPNQQPSTPTHVNSNSTNQPNQNINQQQTNAHAHNSPPNTNADNTNQHNTPPPKQQKQQPAGPQNFSESSDSRHPMLAASTRDRPGTHDLSFLMSRTSINMRTVSERAFANYQIEERLRSQDLGIAGLSDLYHGSVKRYTNLTGKVIRDAASNLIKEQLGDFFFAIQSRKICSEPTAAALTLMHMSATRKEFDLIVRQAFMAGADLNMEEIVSLTSQAVMAGSFGER